MEMPYKRQIPRTLLDVVATKKGQHEVNAPYHGVWDTVKCTVCNDEFLIGPPRMFNVHCHHNHYIRLLRATLLAEHERQQAHLNDYDLGW